ncbi:MAG: hypothetical protein ACPG4T_08705 [Nannocystaceae bacterium]
MLRRLGSVVLGVLTGSLVVFVIQSIGHAVVEMPSGFDPNDPASIAAVADQIPLAALLFVLVSYLLGVIAGGFVAAKITAKQPMLHAHIVGAVFLLMGVLNLMMIPHPVWFAIASLLVFSPSAHVGGRLAQA